MIFPGDQLKIPTVGGKYQASVFENFFSPSLSSSPLLVIERSKTTSLSLSLVCSRRVVVGLGSGIKGVLVKITVALLIVAAASGIWPTIKEQMDEK